MHLWPPLQDAEYRAGNGVTDREAMEKALTPFLSNFNLVVVVPVYAFREQKAHGNQGFSALADGVAE